MRSYKKTAYRVNVLNITNKEDIFVCNFFLLLIKKVANECRKKDCRNLKNIFFPVFLENNGNNIC